ncbi:MFS transporter [Edwardsiella tarda]|uniref:MFS transporter n=1 Tax=Edwardsiella tarda TaxID=636 RepID=UPI00351C116E
MERVAVQMTGRWQLAMIIAAILPLLDSSIINVILPDIAQSLQSELATMPWLVTLYLIASAAGVLLSGYLTARWGLRCVWRASLTVFAAASVVLALASRFDVMLLGRALLGVAAGVMMVLVPTLIVVSVAADQVKTMMGRISVPAVFAPAAGPLLGALLSESGSWRLAFWLNLPLVAVALWLGWPMVRENVRAAARFNRVVFLLFFLSFFCLMLSLISGPYFAAAALLLLGLALWLNQIMTEPLLTLALFRHAHYAALMGLGVLTALLFYGFLVYYPLASVSQGDFPVWYLGAMLALQGVGSGIGRRWLYPRLASWSDFGVMALGLALSLMSLVLIRPGHAGWQGLGFLVRGGGIGLALLVLLSAPYRLTPRIWVNDTSMLIRMVQLIGGVLGGLFSTALLAANVSAEHGYLGFMGLTLLATLGAAYFAWRLDGSDV